jgi:hypothetical protein
VSPWSRESPHGRLILAVVLLAGAVAPGLTRLEAQESTGEAVLLRGPEAVRGVPVYAPNRIAAFQGVYRLGSETLEVLFTRQQLYVPAEWTPRLCGSLRLFEVEGAEPFSLCYRHQGAFFLFFFFPDAQEPAYWCRFAASFVERFLFLLSFVDNETDVPFPAILTFRD